MSSHTAEQKALALAELQVEIDAIPGLSPAGVELQWMAAQGMLDGLVNSDLLSPGEGDAWSDKIDAVVERTRAAPAKIPGRVEPATPWPRR